MNDLKPSTVAVQAGRPPHTPDEPLNVPIYLTSTFVGGGEREYGRSGNPTWAAFETALGALEGGRAISFASGMGAITAVLSLIGQDQAIVLPRHSYTGTVLAAGDLETRGHVRTRMVDVTSLDDVRAALDDETALVWLESPTNPAMEIADIPAIVAMAHEVGATVVVDNTFATPVLRNPLALGADLVVHSATKFIAGHSDLLMGAVVTADDEIHDAILARRTLLGAVPGPFEAWLALRGLRTLPLRVERASRNAAVLAERLASHAAIAEVRYPGWGAMIAAILTNAVGGAEAADRLVRSTSIWAHATSLGGVESTFERRRRWAAEPATIPDALVRFSVGIEDVDDLWDDLGRALDALL